MINNKLPVIKRTNTGFSFVSEGISTEIEIIHSNRRSLSLEVQRGSGKVTLRAPLRVSDNVLYEVIRKRADWLIKHLTQPQGIYRSVINQQYNENENILYLGSEYRLVLQKGDDGITVMRDQIVLSGMDGISQQHLKKRMILWYRDQAVSFLTQQFMEARERYLLPEKQSSTLLRFRWMKTRWGTCSSHGIITLNYELILLPPEVIEYIILHEICHLQHPNHGKSFHNSVAQWMPDWKIRRKWLKKVTLQ